MKIRFILFLIVGIFVSGQELPFSAPMPNNQLIPFISNYQSYIETMDNYWENTPHNYKGSGIKPYLRWKENSSYLLDENGEMLTADEIASSWNRVLELRNNPINLDNNSNWEPLGPISNELVGNNNKGQGRLNVVTVDPADANTIYVGAPDGGIWKSTDDGSNWVSIGDVLPSWGVSGIAVDYSNSNIIYISTGDEDGGDSPTIGVYKTTDGGVSWSATGSISASILGEIYINPTNSNMLWVCSNNGLYKSIDAGATWSLKISGNVKELRLKPGDPNTVYALKQGSSTVEIMKSTNAGDAFTTIKTYTNAGRSAIAVTAANAAYLYVLVSNSDNTFNSIWRSTDSGTTFTSMNNTTNVYGGSNQAWFDLALGVSDTNSDLIYTGCLDLWNSTNGGSTMIQQNLWYVNSPKYTHADIHDIKFFNGKIYVCSDGGLYVSSNNGLTFVDKTVGMNISQFYRVDVAQNNFSRLAGGLQDNGGFAYANNTWINYHGGDGMDAAINPVDGANAYGFTQYGGSLSKMDLSNPTSSDGITGSPTGEQGDWITPLEFGNSGTLYSGFKKLYKLNGSSWSAVNATTFNFNLKQIRVASDNDNKVLVTDGAKLYQTDGTSAMVFNELSAPFVFGWPGGIKNFDYNRNNSSIIYVLTGTNIYKTVNGGTSWTVITGSIPTTDSKVAIIHQANSVNNTLYLATRNAVYYINDNLTDWQLFSTNLPHTQIRDIEVNNVENNVIIATYGRGIWRSPVDTESLGVEDVNAENSKLVIYPNPVADYAKVNLPVNEKAVVKVFNTEGKLVIEKSYDMFTTDTQIDLQTLRSGIYLITITSPTHLITQKFIKK